MFGGVILHHVVFVIAMNVLDFSRKVGQRTIHFLFNVGQVRMLDFSLLQAVQVAKHHDHGLPLVSVDPIAMTFHPQVLVDADPEDPDLDQEDETLGGSTSEHLVGGDQLGFHDDGTLFDPRTRDVLGRARRQARDAELVLDEAVSTRSFALGNRVGACSPRKRVDRVGHVVGGEIQDALFSAQDVLGRLGRCVEAEDATMTEPERRGHGTDVGGSVWIIAGDENYRSTPVENGGRNILVLHVRPEILWSACGVFVVFS